MNTIVFVWSQYNGGNIDKEQWLRFPPKPNEAKLNIMGGDFYCLTYCNSVQYRTMLVSNIFGLLYLVMFTGQI